MQHVLVSETADAYGFIDHVLVEQGRSRKIALTVPNFMSALAVIADSDLISALPRKFFAMYASRFGVVGVEPPLPLARSRLNIIVSKAAMMNAGIEWLVTVLGDTRS